MDSQVVIRQMKEHFVVDGLSPEQVLERLKEKTGYTEPGELHYFLMTSYMASRRLVDDSGERIDQEGEISDSAKRVLQTLVPDLEERLPWYEVMFDIMHRGEFNDGTDDSAAGPWSFLLGSELRRELTDYLVRERRLEETVAGFLVSRLALDMGNPPGLQYNTQLILDSHNPSDFDRITLICKFLHLPMRTIVTVKNEETMADFLYEGIQEYLQPSSIGERAS